MAISLQLQQNPPRPAQTADGPWMDNKKWASGRIGDSSTSSMIFFWVFAIFWNAVAMPALYVGVNQMRSDKPATYLLLLFPLVGLGLLACAGYATLRYVTFGRAYFELETLPGSIGGWLAGTIRTSAMLDQLERLEVSLRCSRRITTGSGKRRSTHESTIWVEEQVYTGRLPHDRSGGHAFPVAFRIPPDALPTYDSSREDIIWRLRLCAPMPGADFAATFIVPVFPAPQPDGFIPQAEHAAAKLRAPRAAVIALDDPQIHISTNAAGRKRIVFPAGRNRRLATLLTVLFVTFGGVAIGAATMGAPLLVPLISGVIACFLGYAAALFLFRHIELLVDRQGIERQWRMLGFTGTRAVAAGEIVEITKKVTAEANDTPYHTVYAIVQDGKTVALISNLRAGDAAHVVEEIVNALGSASSARS